MAEETMSEEEVERTYERVAAERDAVACDRRDSEGDTDGEGE